MMPDWNHATPLASTVAYSQAMIPLRVEGADPTNPALDTFSQVAVATVISAAANAAVGTCQAASIDLMVNLVNHAIPSAVTAILTGGYALAGVGGATYVADSLATATLASACPRFCAADRAGRFFRLAPQAGKIALSQGGALGGANNDQPALQAAINYCAAIGCRELGFDFDTVSIWNTVRTNNAAQSSTNAFAQDGQSIWVTTPIKFTGLPTQTHIKLLSTIGTSLETGWQNVGGNVWRGSGINLLGGPSLASPGTYGLTTFAMENIWLDGGCAYTGARTAVTPASPDGPDLTNKGIRLQNTKCDAITLTNCVISGFKGEACYLAGTTQTIQILKNITISGSNQSAFNPSTGVVWADNCSFGNSFISVECLGGIGGRYSNCRFYDCAQTGVTGGPANGLLYNYAYPTRDTSKAPPWIDLVNCDFHNAGQLLVGNYLRIVRSRATDITIALNTADTNGVLTSTYIDLEYTVDQATQSPICALTGPPTLTTLIPGASAGNYILPPSDVHVRLNIHRSAFAKANGRYAVAYSIGGYVDQNSCSLAVGEADGVAYLMSVTSNFALPLISMDGPTSSHLIGSGRPLGIYPAAISAGPYALTVSNPRMSLLYSGSAAAIALTMAAPFTAPFGFAFGQKVRIYFDPATTVGSTFTFAHNGTGLRLNADCTLALYGDWLEAEFNAATGLWHECGRSIHAA
jgi:hypothetical protein